MRLKQWQRRRWDFDEFHAGGRLHANIDMGRLTLEGVVLRRDELAYLAVIPEHDVRQRITDRAHQLVDVRLLRVRGRTLRQTLRPRQIERDREPYAVDEI